MTYQRLIKNVYGVSAIRTAFQIVLFIILIIKIEPAFAQKTDAMLHPQAAMVQARELYRTGKFAAARELFNELSADVSLPPIIREEASFYAASSAAKLMHRDTERKLLDYLNRYPSGIYTSLAHFRLGSFHFENKNYRSALESLQNVNILTLNDEQLAAYYYKAGFCYMQQNDFERAQQYFLQITTANTPYTPAANYFSGYIAYVANQNSDALIFFNRVRNEPEFKEQVALHLTHIHHRTGDFAAVVANAPLHLTRERNKQSLEMARMVGDAHFRLANYSEAQRLLEHFHANGRRQPTRQESYQLGYIYFLTERWNDAIRHFQAVTTENDTLAQFAFYHLAASYLNTNQKQFASNAFLSAHQLPFNQLIREDALLNYAQLAVELGMDPYNEAIRAINQFLVDFPASQRRQEALEYLVHLYVTTNNFREALKSIEAIPNRGRALNEAYQIITYYRGVELFNDRQYPAAIAMFDNTRTQQFDQKIHTQSLFWTAESYYRLNQYENAVQYYNRFLNSPGSRGHALQFIAHYNLGYIHFGNEEYGRAIESFNRFLANERREPPRIVMDALIRSGDALFITKRYTEAIQAYDRAIRRIPAEGDYATLQKARAQGALGKHNDKLTSLQTFMRNFRTSGYAPEALFEAGNTALLLKNNTEAAIFFNQLVNDYPTSSLAKNALMKVGLIHFNAADNNRALETLKRVISKYPGSPESHEALGVVRTIYVELNRVDDFIAFARTLPFTEITDRQQDSLTYMAAFNKYITGNCSTARPAFGTYISRHPQGLYIVNALFYAAECDMRMNNLQSALENYEAVLTHTRSEFTENALLRAARLNFQLNNNERALLQFHELETTTNVMDNRIEAALHIVRINDLNGNHQAVLDATNRLLGYGQPPDAVIAETRLAAGKAAFRLQRFDAALSHLRETSRLAPRSARAAEASYYIAATLFAQGKIKEAENAIFNLASQYASYDHWVASAFILLADIYVHTGNIFQARHTLQSVINNHQGEELREIARQKLQRIQ